MKTKLEMMVGYLAGRQGEAAESIRRELEDPSSEASLWLEAVRSRSRGIFGADSPGGRDAFAPTPSRLPEGRGAFAPTPSHVPATVPAAVSPARRSPSLLLVASAAALVILAVGLAWLAHDDRLRRLEATLVRREARWGDRFDRLEAALTRTDAAPQGQAPAGKGQNTREIKTPTPSDGPTRLAMGRIEEKLGELEQRLGESRTGQDLADQRVAELRRDLDQFRQAVETSNRTDRQEMQELGRVVREILHLLRRLATRPRGSETVQDLPMLPVQPQGQDIGVGRGPGIIIGPGQVPNQGQMPGPDHPHMDPGWGNRDWGAQGFPGGHSGTGVPRPKGSG